MGPEGKHSVENATTKTRVQSDKKSLYKVLAHTRQKAFKKMWAFTCASQDAEAGDLRIRALTLACNAQCGRKSGGRGSAAAARKAAPSQLLQGGRPEGGSMPEGPTGGRPPAS